MLSKDIDVKSSAVGIRFYIKTQILNQNTKKNPQGSKISSRESHGRFGERNNDTEIHREIREQVGSIYTV